MCNIRAGSSFYQCLCLQIKDWLNWFWDEEFGEKVDSFYRFFNVDEALKRDNLYHQ